MGHYRPGSGSPNLAQVFHISMVRVGPSLKVQSEADMSRFSINEGDRAHHTVAAAFWLLVGIVALVAFGDVLAVLAVALAVVTAALWAYREVEHRLQGDDAAMASVTALRPAMTGASDLQHGPTHASWRDPRAA
jgi:hypothetical protein